MDAKRILIIDPDVKFRKSVVQLLKNEGYSTESSKSLTDAIQRMIKTSYHCVIMDVKLPEIKGYKAVSILKNLDPQLKIIMTTGRNSMRLETKVRNQDIYYYFIKSFGFEELKTAINSLFISYKKEAGKMERTCIKGKILVIDDDADFREAVSLVLKSAFYEVITATNPKEGKQKLFSEKPNLILLDIMMDTLFDGYSLCTAIKTEEEYKEFRKTPVIFVSAVKEQSGSRFSFSTGEQGFAEPDDHISKPIQPGELLKRIEKILKK